MENLKNKVLALGLVAVSLFLTAFSCQINFNFPPVAVASADKISGFAPLKVKFSGHLSYDPDGGTLRYFWNLGDGTQKEGLEVKHTFIDDSDFNNDGVQEGYKVILTVVDDEGMSASSEITIFVYNPAPTAYFSYYPKIPNQGEEVTFNARNSVDPAGIVIKPIQRGRIVEYIWDFGDGRRFSTSSPVVSHIFYNYGTFRVSLVTKDDDGAFSEPFYRDIRVNALPIPNFVWRNCAIEIQSKGIVLPETKCIEFDASSSYDPDGYIKSYYWKIKRVGSFKGKVIQVNLEVGKSYEVELKVRDNLRGKNTLKKVVYIH